VYCLPGITSNIAGGDIVGAALPVSIAKRLKLLYPPVPASPASPSQHYASGLYLASDNKRSAAVTAGVIAHEMGHYMNIIGHSTHDVEPPPKWTRDDSVTRRRLMYPNDELFDVDLVNRNLGWRNDVGYGEKVHGALITYRRIPDTQDAGFGESGRARLAAVAPGFYAA
jgi:hypothetical protein